MSEYSTIRYEAKDGIARLTLNRPERLNGMTNRMVIETGEADLVCLAPDRRTIVVVEVKTRVVVQGRDAPMYAPEVNVDHRKRLKLAQVTRSLVRRRAGDARLELEGGNLAERCEGKRPKHAPQIDGRLPIDFHTSRGRISISADCKACSGAEASHTAAGDILE